MSKEKGKVDGGSRAERIFAPLAFLTGNPTNPHAVPLSTNAPEGLALVYSAASPPEADWVRQVLLSAEFHVEYVAASTTGVFGTSGNVHVYVHAGQEKEAREFLSQLREKAAEEHGQEDQV